MHCIASSKHCSLHFESWAYHEVGLCWRGEGGALPLIISIEVEVHDLASHVRIIKSPSPAPGVYPHVQLYGLIYQLIWMLVHRYVYVCMCILLLTCNLLYVSCLKLGNEILA